MDFKIFEPDFLMEFFNTEVIKSRKDEEEALTTQILADWPWLIAYWSRKQIIVGQKFRNAKAIEIPSKDEMIWKSWISLSLAAETCLTSQLR